MLCEYLIFLNKTILIRMKAWDFKNIAIFFSYQDSADEVLDTICFVWYHIQCFWYKFDEKCYCRSLILRLAVTNKFMLASHSIY